MPLRDTLLPLQTCIAFCCGLLCSAFKICHQQAFEITPDASVHFCFRQSSEVVFALYTQAIKAPHCLEITAPRFHVVSQLFWTQVCDSHFIACLDICHRKHPKLFRASRGVCISTPDRCASAFQDEAGVQCWLAGVVELGALVHREHAGVCAQRSVGSTLVLPPIDFQHARYPRPRRLPCVPLRLQMSHRRRNAGST